MRRILLVTAAAGAIIGITSAFAVAMPATGAAGIAKAGKQVETVVTIKTKKKPASTAPCPTDQERSTRTGLCRPASSQRNG
jgi:hypothetical protein